jgi:hypothetical protein
MWNASHRSGVIRAACVLCSAAVGIAVLSAPAIAAAPGVQSFIVWDSETEEQASPVVVGDVIVWRDWGSPSSPSPLYRRLKMLDSVAARVTTFRSVDEDAYLGDPSFDGAHVVWSDDARTAGSAVRQFDLLVYDTASKVTTTLGLLGGQYPLDLSDGRAALVGVFNDQSGVWVIDVHTKAATKVADAGEQVAISGDWVVWTDDTELHAKNLSTTESKTIAGSFGELGFDGTRVVYTSEHDLTSGHDILGLDIATGASFEVCTALGDQAGPHISGSYVVWEDRHPGPDPDSYYDFDESLTDIYGRDLTGGGERRLAGPGAIDPRTDGVSVTWTTLRREAWCAKLTERPVPSIELTSAPTIPFGGTATLTGRLTDPSGAPMANRLVRLLVEDWFSSFERPTWLPTIVATTTANGEFTFKHRPSSYTSYRADFVPTVSDAYAPSASTTVTVGPKPDVHIGWSSTKAAGSTVKKVTRGHPPGVFAIVGDGGTFLTGTRDIPVLETWRKEKKNGKYVWVLRSEDEMQGGYNGKGAWAKHSTWNMTAYQRKKRSFTAGSYRVRIRAGGPYIREYKMDGNWSAGRWTWSWDLKHYFATSYSRWAYITVK